MRMSNSFMNVYSNKNQNGYIFRVCGVNIEYFSNKTNKSLKDALRARNLFYQVNNYMPESIFIRYAKKSIPTLRSQAGYTGISLQICPKRLSAPLLAVVNVQNLITRKQSRVHFIVNNRNLQKSDGLKKAIETRNKNVEQHNKIVDIYNEMIFVKMMKLAIVEEKTLIPTLYKYSKVNSLIWKQAFKKTFPLGLEKPYRAIQ